MNAGIAEEEWQESDDGDLLSKDAVGGSDSLDRFAGYELLEEIAHGGMGVIYRARQTRLNRIVAIKMIAAGRLASAADVQRFRTEAEAAASLDHPQIVPIYEVGEHEGRQFFSMRYVDGGTLAARMEEFRLPESAASRGEWSQRQARLASFLVEVSRAVHYAHQRGILHRDLKPGNILIDKKAGPQVADFGLAKLTEKESDLTQSVALLGTPNYMSPEQALGGGGRLTTASDLFALGAIFYELLTGSPPFRSATVLETLRRVKEEEPIRPRARNRAIDVDLETICLKCLEKDPKARYGSAEALAEDLERWRRGEPIWARPSTVAERTRKWVRRKPAVASLTAIVALTAVVGLWGILWQWGEAERARAHAVSIATALTKEEQSRRRAHDEVAAGLRRLEVRKAMELFRADRESAALAYLARVLRESSVGGVSTNEAVAQQIVMELSRRNFAVPVARLAVSGESSSNPGPVRFSPDSRWLVESGPGRVKQVFDAVEGTRLIDPSWCGATNMPYRSFQFSPNNRWILAFSSNSVHVLDALEGRSVWELPGELHGLGGAPSGVEFSPKGDRLVALYPGSNGARVYEVGSRRLRSEIRPTAGRLSAARFSPDGWGVLTTASASDGMSFFRLWRAETGEAISERLRIDERCGLATFRPDERTVLIPTHLSRNVDAYVWDYVSDTLTPVPTDRSFPNGRLVISPDGACVLRFSRYAIQIWRPGSGEAAVTCPLDPGWSDPYVRFSPDGQRVFTVSNLRHAQSRGRIWDAVTGQALGVAIQPDAPITSAGFTIDGRWLVTECHGAMVRIWDGYTGLPVTGNIQVSEPSRGRVVRASVSPDGRRLLTASSERGRSGEVFQLWHVRLGNPRMGEEATDDPWDDLLWGLRTASSVGDAAGSRIPSSRSGLTALLAAPGVPEWLPELAEAIGGLRLTAARVLERVPFSERVEARRDVLVLADDDPYARWAKWLYLDPEVRTVEPFSEETSEAYVGRCLEADRYADLVDALWLAPDHPGLHAQIARQLLSEESMQNGRRLGEADFHSRRALVLAPEDPLVLSIRVSVLAATGRIAEALQLLNDRGPALQEDPELLNAQGVLLERVGRYEEALASYTGAIDRSRALTRGGAERRADYYFNRSGCLQRVGRVEEAAADFESGVALRAPAHSPEWRAWGGNDPGRNLYSDAVGLPFWFDPGDMIPGTEDFELSVAKHVKWIAKMGSQSYGDVVVAGGKVFVGTNNEHPRDARHVGDRSILLCLDEQTGGFLWQLVVPKLRSGKVNDWEYLGLVSAPAVEGNRLYIPTSRCEVLALTTDGLGVRNVGPFTDEGLYAVANESPELPPGRRDADIIWKYDMMDQLGVFPHNATRSSPLVLGDLIYVGTSNGQDWSHRNVPSPLSPSLIAINKWTGELAGEDDAEIGSRIFHAQWGSPSAGTVNGKTLVFFGGGDGVCYAFDARPVPDPEEPEYAYLRKVWWADCNPPEYKMRNGKPIQYPAADGPSEIHATPVFWKDRVYIATGQDPEHGEGRGNLVCLDATGKGDITESGLIWSNRDVHRTLSTVSITPDGLLFIADFSGYVHCIDAETGKTYWTHDMRAHMWGSTLAADGKVFVGDEDGDFVVLAASREKAVLSRMTTADGKESDGPNLGAPIYSTPVVANGVLYVLSQTHLFAVEDKSAKVAENGLLGGAKFTAR